MTLLQSTLLICGSSGRGATPSGHTPALDSAQHLTESRGAHKKQQAPFPLVYQWPEQQGLTINAHLMYRIHLRVWYLEVGKEAPERGRGGYGCPSRGYSVGVGCRWN